jgi:hypothetical protein
MQQNKFLDEKLSTANSRQRTELASLLRDADALCESPSAYVSQDKQTAEDRRKHQEIGKLRVDMWNWEAYSGYDGALNSLADYLDALAKRVVSDEV